MSKLPWVSRLAYDQLEQERDWLREQNATLLEHVRRMDRVEHGLGELPRTPRAELQPMPIRLAEHFRTAYANKSIAKMQRDEAYRRHASGVSWPAIEQEIFSAETERTGEHD